MIDLYQIHWPEPDGDVEEGWTALAKLKEQGKVRWIGVSNFNARQLERCRPIAPITSLQPPYSAISPEVRNRIAAVLFEARDRRDCLFANEIGAADGKMTKERVAAFPPDDFRRRALNFQEPHSDA